MGLFKREKSVAAQRKSRVSVSDPLSRIQAAAAAWLTRPPFRTCLVADTSCTGPAIQAHSVQRAAVLSAIAEAGHVYMFQHRIGSAFRLKRIGLREATTFAGFCDYHDRELFREIDFGPMRTLDPTDKRQAVLLGFRALACEYWNKLTVRLFYRRIFDCQRRRDTAGLKELFGLDFGNIEEVLANQTEIGRMLKGFDYAIKRMERWFASLLVQLQQNNFHLSHYEVFEISGPPLVAAAAVFTPYLEFYRPEAPASRPEPYSHLYDVAITVFPEKERTLVSFLVHRRWATHFKGYLHTLLNYEGLGFPVTLSKLLLHCENVAFAPSLVAALSAEVQNHLCSIFQASIERPVSITEVEDVNFFQMPELAA